MKQKDTKPEPNFFPFTKSVHNKKENLMLYFVTGGDESWPSHRFLIKFSSFIFYAIKTVSLTCISYSANQIKKPSYHAILHKPSHSCHLNTSKAVKGWLTLIYADGMRSFINDQGTKTPSHLHYKKHVLHYNERGKLSCTLTFAIQ